MKKFVVRWFKRLTSKQFRYQELKQQKWNQFVKDNATRISYLPTKNGRKSVPAVWDKRIKNWIWVTRGQRRNLEKHALLRRRALR